MRSDRRGGSKFRPLLSWCLWLVHGHSLFLRSGFTAGEEDPFGLYSTRKPRWLAPRTPPHVQFSISP